VANCTFIARMLPLAKLGHSVDPIDFGGVRGEPIDEWNCIITVGRRIPF